MCRDQAATRHCGRAEFLRHRLLDSIAQGRLYIADASHHRSKLGWLKGRPMIRARELAIECEMFLDNAGTQRSSAYWDRNAFGVVRVAHRHIEPFFERMHCAQVYAGGSGRIVAHTVQ